MHPQLTSKVLTDHLIARSATIRCWEGCPLAARGFVSDGPCSPARVAALLRAAIPSRSSGILRLSPSSWCIGSFEAASLAGPRPGAASERTGGTAQLGWPGHLPVQASLRF